MKTKSKVIVASLALALFTGATVSAASGDPLQKLKDLSKGITPSTQPIITSNSNGSDNVVPTYLSIKTTFKDITKQQLTALNVEAAKGYNPIGMFKLGVANEVRGDLEASTNSYLNAIALMPKSVEFYKGLLSIYDVKQKGTASVFANGKKIDLDVKPRMVKGNMLIPLRAVSEALGATVGWNSKTSTAKLSLWANQVELTENDSKAIRNGREVKLSAPAQSFDGRIFVPLRFIGESFDMKVEYLTTKNQTTIIPIFGKN